MKNGKILLRIIVGMLPAIAVLYLIYYVGEYPEIMPLWVSAVLILCLALLSLYILVGVMSDIQLAEAMEKNGDRHFFGEIETTDTPDSLREKLIEAGFRDRGDGVLCRRKLSFGLDLINYCTIIESCENGNEVSAKASSAFAESLTSGNGVSSKNVCVFRICFTSGVTPKMLEHIKKEIIADELANDAANGGRNSIISAVCPIIYDTAAHKYILRSADGVNAPVLLNKAYAYFKRIICSRADKKEMQ